MPPDWQRLDQGSRNSSRVMTVVRRSFEHHTSVTVQFGPFFYSNFEGGYIGVIRGIPHLQPTSREDLWPDNYLDYSHAAKTRYIYKHLCLSGNQTQGLKHSNQRN
ncbi:hypothetical protein TNCV_2878171 [Trichonephila clavipes]|uniref:Uncharacterized protein n=1 Tax=Trichonephila clavipes TaxID=2585209 RepID=A0A8X6W282_TRICX|nr:hypothetical protein TNCV_2878171 [Trichonephila clavipes]